MEYRSDIQILRGIAVLMVVLFHLDFAYFQNGFLGVDVFFVISGYLMAMLYNRGTALEFFARRIKRLVPAYLVVIGVTVFVSALITVPVDFDQVVTQALFGLLGLSNMGFWLENSYFDPAAFKPLLNLWSLGVELQYYLIVPLLLLLLRRHVLLFSLFLLAALIVSLRVTTINPKTSFFWMPFRVWEFLLGAAAAWYFQMPERQSRGLMISCISIGLLAAMMAYPLKADSYSVLYGHPGVASFLIAIVTAFILIRPLHHVISDQNMLGRGFVVLGKYSYSIYLVHFPVIVLFNYSAFDGTILGYKDLAALLWIVGTTVVLSIFLYHCVETMRDKKYFNGRLLACILFCVGLTALSIPLNDRSFTNEQQKIFAAWTDRTPYRCGKVFRILNPTSDLCYLSDPTLDKRVLFVGNSHADSIKTQFSNAMKSRGFSTLFYVTNEPLMGGKITPQKLLEHVRDFDAYAVVFHYSPSYYTHKQGKNLRLMREAVELLQEGGIDISIIAPVPWYTFHVPKALYEASLRADSIVEGMRADEYLAANSEFYRFIEEISHLPVRIYYPHEILCAGEMCLLSNDGHPFYYDRGHFTLTGAQYLEPMFNSIARDIGAMDRPE